MHLYYLYYAYMAAIKCAKTSTGIFTKVFLLTSVCTCAVDMSNMYVYPYIKTHTHCNSDGREEQFSLLYFYFMYMAALPAGMSVHHLCAVSTEARRERQMPWD